MLSFIKINFSVQVNLRDKFGEIMLYNMQQRACKLAGSEVCNSVESQLNRFALAGFDVLQCITLTDFYLNRLDRKERDRIEGLEFLDEKELLIQLLDHYCVCVAGNYAESEQILFNWKQHLFSFFLLFFYILNIYNWFSIQMIVAHYIYPNKFLLKFWCLNILLLFMPDKINFSTNVKSCDLTRFFLYYAVLYQLFIYRSPHLIC